jgi:predicted 3-demethylubiquinone-9 3-methyltransferase (glyoxalase superfamily)
MPIQKITPFLWFDHQAEESANFYTSIFPNSKIIRVIRCVEGGPRPAGAVLTVEFQLEGLTFVALNGGPYHKFTEAVSFVVNCQTQEEVDTYWDKLTAGGAPIECGWLKDKYGLCWQIVPTLLLDLLAGSAPAKAQRAMQAMMGMKKLDIAALRQAAEKP